MDTSTARDFVHPALLYRDADEYLAGTVPFVREGLAAGEPVAAAVPPANLALLQAALGADADGVAWRDMTVVGRNPGAIIPTVLLAFANAHAGHPVRIIGEPIWAGRTRAEYPACAQHEALINAAFDGRAATILCPYDVSALDPVWVDDAHRTHPVMVTPTRRWDSRHYTDPVALAAEFNHPLPDPPARAATTVVDVFTVRSARRFAADVASRAGFPAARLPDLTLAVNELAANSVRHGGGSGRLAVWAEGDQLVCQLSDSGYVADPLAGRIPPAPGSSGGRGLMMVHQLCDLVRVHSTSAGTTVRIQLRIGRRGR
jgi:anti-sigma regulatory factor (Ser/Thr protein kinase)